jgi:aspartyl-tRNA(Asn)/glutamyl-tRNA(Gln) amidotransferase subunit C
MGNVDIAEIEKIAHIARIEMSDKEKADMAKSVNEVLDYLEPLKKVNTDGVKPTMYMSANNGVFREDVAGIEFTQEEALANAPVPKKGHFAVPKVIG